MNRAAERRSPEAAAYRPLYWTARWRAMRADQLARQPLCETHLRAGYTVAATVANHRRPHRGDEALFWDEANLQSVCKACHDSPIARDEATGYGREVGPDGFPTDPLHPANRPA